MNRIPRLLVIDDDEINVFIINKIVEKIGYEVNFASKSDGEIALSYIKDLYFEKHLTPDIILMDINMPIMDGWEFLAEYEKLGIEKAVDIYILSSSVYDHDIQRAKTFNFVKGFLSKPLSAEQLKEMFSALKFQTI